MPACPAHRPMFESLEDRRLMSAAPLTLARPTPAKILAGSTGYQTVTVRNLSATPVTETVAVHLAPSLDGTTPVGAYASPDVTQSVTLKPHASAKLKVAFVPPGTLAAGAYHTLATVTVDGAATTLAAPGTYTLKLPPGPTVTPGLVGHYSGLIYSSETTHSGTFNGGKNTRVKEASFIWQTTDQTLTALTGLFAVGSGQETATMTGGEDTTGAVTYTLTTPTINYTLKGKVTPDGSVIKGTFRGTLVNNIFANLNGTFKLTRQAS